MKLVYEAFDESGRSVTDSLDAASAVEATKSLRRKGLFVTRIQQDGAAMGVTKRVSRRGRAWRGARLRNVPHSPDNCMC